MIFYFKDLKFNKLNRGMTYVELIVVLSIFAVMSSIVIFSYGDFQAKVDIKNLASDIALKIVEAQKSALSGKLPVSPPANWKPSYGVYFNTSTSTLQKQFIYFADLDNDKIHNQTALDTISITKGNYIEKIETCISSTCNLINPTFLSITFKRPDSRAVFSSLSNIELSANFNYVQITIKSPKTASAKIKIFPSGRIQVN